MQRVGQVGLVLVKGPIWVVILVVPHVELPKDLASIPRSLPEVKVGKGKLCLGICGGHNVTGCGGPQRPLTKRRSSTTVFFGGQP